MYFIFQDNKFNSKNIIIIIIIIITIITRTAR